MVKELRKIVFSRDEMISMLESFKRISFEFLPPGKIVSCELKNGAPAKIGIEMVIGEKVQPAIFKVDPPRLLEPMIHYCLEHKIVLPRNSRKTAIIGDNNANLFIQINTAGKM